MKFITAIIEPFKLEAARAALSEAKVSGVTITEVQGYGRQKGHTEIYRGAEYLVDFVPKVKLEIAVADDQLGTAIESILKGVGTGRIGDGKIFVVDMEAIVRIRTGETGPAAL